MKRENINEVNRVVKRLDTAEKSVDQIKKFLSINSDGNSDGGCSFNKKTIYNLHVTEHSDGSGLNIDLCGSLIQTEVLKFVLESLEKQIEKDSKYIETL